jgi:hypothetical protein
MGDIVRSMVWFAIVATATSYAIFAVLGNFAAASAADEGPIPVRDLLEPGVHHLSGMVMVPSACDELTVRAQQISTTTYQLAFQTWQDPSVPCPTDPTPREFNVVAFAPSTGVEFSAALDGRQFPIAVIPDVMSTVKVKSP